MGATETTVNDESNPFRAPSVAVGTSESRRYVAINVTTVVLLLTIAAGLAAETYEHESIIGSGPVLFMVGTVLVFLGIRLKQPLASVLGALSVFLCVLVVFLINFNGWGPAEGDAPITVIVWVYAAIAVPLALYSFLLRTEAT